MTCSVFPKDVSLVLALRRISTHLHAPHISISPIASRWEHVGRALGGQGDSLETLDVSVLNLAPHHAIDKSFACHLLVRQGDHALLLFHTSMQGGIKEAISPIAFLLAPMMCQKVLSVHS